MELIRRFLLVFGLLGGVWTYVETTPFLLSVSAEDFARSKKQVEDRPTGFLHRDKTLVEFYERRTKGRIRRIDDVEWQRLYADVLAVTNGETGDEELRRRQGLDHNADCLYFLPDEHPTGSVAGSLGEFSALLYVSIGGEGPTARTLAVVRVEGADAGGRAPSHMLHPHRPWALWLVLVGLAGYFFLPKPSRGPGVIYYASARAIVMPDLLGAGLLALFFGMPFLVATSNGVSLLDFDDGWWILGAVFGFLSIAPLVILVISTRNAAFSLRATDNGLVIHRWSGTRQISYASIETIELVEWRTPPWLKLIARLMILVSWRAMLPAVMFGQGQGLGLELVLRGSSRERIWLSALLGWEGLIENLLERGVSVAEEVRELAQQCSES